jgi:LmbE family N-acetylglucosaminyl deacetylase
MNILAIGAHFDDVELGCGGSLLAWRDLGHSLTVFVATVSGYRDPQGNLIRSNEAARAEGLAVAKKMGATLIEGGFPHFDLEFSEPLNSKLIQIIRDIKPDLVLTHWPDDTHPDHRALASATLHVCRHLPRVLLYCSNWYESDQRFDPRFFVDISVTLEQKLKLIELHQSENTRTHGTWLDYTRAQAKMLGAKTGVEYAEGFQVVKWLM